ncbi:MAG: DUF4296 domain-containing protein [Bacteroidales bacterium]|nr:DUF4296 domain-containing protein [Bacteroidales bacterium]MDY5193477.1 DUF4296 domain-containing protein [Candidatus Aphodosoma sp.]
MTRLVQIILLSGLLCLTSCDIRPWSVLNKQEMEDLLFDIHLAETIFQVYKPNYSKEEKQQIFEGIFEKHNTSKETFEKSLKWYAKHPDDLQLIYRKVLDRTVAFQEKVDNHEFHPDSRLSALDSIDTFNLWLGRRKIVLSHIKKADKVERDLHLSYINDGDKYIFAKDTLCFNVKLRAISADSTIYRTSMIMTYDDGSTDSLMHYSYADSLIRNIRFTKVVPEDKKISALDIIVIDSLRGINSLYIDTLLLDKKYDKFNNRFSFDVLKYIINKHDSINRVEKDLFDK